MQTTEFLAAFDYALWWDRFTSIAGAGGVILVGLVLVILAVASWAMNAFSLPGNWGVVVLAVIAAFIPSSFESGYDGPPLMDWPTIVVLVVLAGVGELLEMVTGAAGAAKRGASRRAMALSLIGAMTGSIAGATVGVPIAVVGPLIGAILGGAVGAFGGAYLGEAWKGRGHGDRVHVGSAAFTGKIAGTAAKILVGAVMCAAFAVSLIV